MKTSLIYLSVLGLLLYTSSAFSAGLPERELRRELVKSQRQCVALNCETASINAESSDVETLPEVVQTGLNLIAEQMVQVWGDTILEGDFVAADEFHLDSVESLLLKGEHVGYRITYSSKAWDTSTCGYDQDEKALDTCAEGRIIEKGVVTLDGSSYFVDPANYAHFSQR